MVLWFPPESATLLRTNYLIVPMLIELSGSRGAREFLEDCSGFPLDTRPDLACVVSVAAQVLTKDIRLLKVRLRHLLQYLNTTRTHGLMYTYPKGKDKKHDLTEFTVFSDASFSPGGKHSQSGYSIHLSYGSARHLVHWQSSQEPKVAESSAEAELYALSTSRKSARNFRLLTHE